MILQNVPIADINIIKTFKKLRYLDLSGQNLSDLAFLSELTQLQRLWLNNNNLTSIAPLQKLEKLRMLYLNNNRIRDISPLQDLVKLTDLHVSTNEISDITILKQLQRLYWLDIETNKITDFSPIAGMESIKFFIGYDNTIESMPFAEQRCPLNAKNKALAEYCQENNKGFGKRVAKLYTGKNKDAERNGNMTIMGIESLRKAFSSKQYKQVVEYAPAAFEKLTGSDKIDLSYMYAESHYQLGNMQLADIAFYDFIRLAPTSDKVPMALLRQGECNQRTGDMKHATMSYDELIDKFPKSPEADIAKKYLNLVLTP